MSTPPLDHPPASRYHDALLPGGLFASFALFMLPGMLWLWTVREGAQPPFALGWFLPWFFIQPAGPELIEWVDGGCRASAFG